MLLSGKFVSFPFIYEQEDCSKKKFYRMVYRFLELHNGILFWAVFLKKLFLVYIVRANIFEI